jgi:hypothetical protein
MKDFNDYKRQSSKSQADAMDMIKNFASKYEGASENQLVAEIIKEAEKGRRNGTLTDSDIERFKSMIEPMLSREQRAKLNKIVNTIKKN